MGNQTSSSSSPLKKRSGRRSESQTAADIAAERAKRVVGDLQEGIKNSVKKLDDDHPAAQFIDQICGVHFEEEKYRDKYRDSRSASYYSEDVSEDGSRTFQSEDDTTYDGRRHGGRGRSDKSVESASYTTQSEYDSDSKRGRRRNISFDTEEESRITQDEPKLISKPLASSFAKRCYFTKAGIGKTTQHYEGLTLTGNVVLMLAAAMKLKGCPTICDEDLRRVEQTYPNQFSRLPDELLLSSGWRRISKYCHFSNKPIPDGIPFFHSKQRLHPAGGYYFLLAAAVGMIRPIDVEPLTKDTLVLLETDFPTQCDATPSVLIRDPEQWVLVNKFCFFSGGPINAEEDVYYQADFDGNPIYMLAFLSPSLTPEELYKLTEIGPNNEPGLKSVSDVQAVESVYDLTERDFDDLKLYHLGPCRALPQYILRPSAWTKVLPPHFLAARQQAMIRAQGFEGCFESASSLTGGLHKSLPRQISEEQAPMMPPEGASDRVVTGYEFQRQVEEEGAFHYTNSSEQVSKEAQKSPSPNTSGHLTENLTPASSRLDPPDDEPPSLKKDSMEESIQEPGVISPTAEASIDEHGFYSVQQPLQVATIQDHMIRPSDYPDHYVSPESFSQRGEAFGEDEPTPLNYFEDSPPSHQVSRFFDEMAQSHGDYCEEEGIFIPQEVDHSDAPSHRSYRNDLHTSQEYHGLEEKKVGMEKDEVDSQLENSVEFVKDECDRSRQGFIDTQDDGKAPFSPGESSTHTGFDSQSHRSPAMRGAHEILKKRRKRFDMMQAGQATDNPSTFESGGFPDPAESEAGADAWEESGSEVTGSVISGSSAWTDDNSAPADRMSRRALILQMARARMKNNKDSPSKQKIDETIAEEDGNITVATDGNTAEFDLTGDLD